MRISDWSSDVCSSDLQLQALADAAMKQWGRIDILVCNAAVNTFFGPSKDIPDDAFDKIMDVNIKSNHWLCNMVAPGMAERGGGAIVIISSVRSEEHTSELQSLMRISYAAFCLK